MEKLFSFLLIVVIMSVARADYTSFQGAYQAGIDHYDAGNYARASKSFEAARILAKVASEGAKARRFLGLSHSREGRYKEARQEIKEVLAMDIDLPLKWSTQLALAQTYLDEKNFVKARVELGQLTKDKDVSWEIRSRAMFDTAQTYLQERKFVEARRVFHSMLEVDGPGSITNLVVEFLIADSYLTERDFSQARKEYEKLLENDNILKPRAQFSIAQSYVLEKDYVRAKSEFEQTLKMKHLLPDLASRVENKLALLSQLAQIDAKLKGAQGDERLDLQKQLDGVQAKLKEE